MSLSYDLFYAVAAILTSPIWCYHLLRTGKWRTDWSGRFGRGDALAPSSNRTLLIHAVSVGELNAIRLLVEKLQEADPAMRIIISTTTNTGINRARQLYEPEHLVVRFPFDFSPCVRRFLDRIRPDAVALVELEIWPNFILQCDRRGIPVCVVNGRLSERSFRRYRLSRYVIRPTFEKITFAVVQNKVHGRRFTSLGTLPDRVHVADTMKWDTAKVADNVAGAENLAKVLGLDRSQPIIVAGSTGPGEEQMLIDTCPKKAQLVLVPRKPERFDEVASLAHGIIRRSEQPIGSHRTADLHRLFLLDTMGELRMAYSLADVVIVGRSFLGLYGSDMIEPIALGKPTIIGPCHSDFAHVTEALIDGKGIEVTNRPGQVAAELLDDRERAANLAANGRQVILMKQGATEKHVDLLRKLLGVDGNTG